MSAKYNPLSEAAILGQMGRRHCDSYRVPEGATPLRLRGEVYHDSQDGAFGIQFSDPDNLEIALCPTWGGRGWVGGRVRLQVQKCRRLRIRQ